MEHTKVNKNHQPSNQSRLFTSTCCVEAADTTKQKNAIKDFYYRQVCQLIDPEFAPATNEVCLSPLLWSESFGLRLDG